MKAISSQVEEVVVVVVVNNCPMKKYEKNLFQLSLMNIYRSHLVFDLLIKIVGITKVNSNIYWQNS